MGRQRPGWLVWSITLDGPAWRAGTLGLAYRKRKTWGLGLSLLWGDGTYCIAIWVWRWQVLWGCQT